MTHVALIVTGDLEREALKVSLERLFPTVTFTVEKVDPITSTTVSHPPTERSMRPGAPAWKLIDRLWRAVTKARLPGESEADFAFAIDDVELLNLAPHGEPARIVALVRAVTERFLMQQFSDERARRRHREVLQTKCSFHLLAPMVEAYFFGEREALTRAGVPADREILRAAGDLEDFRANDPTYSAPASTTWQDQRSRRSRGRIDPDRHPKDYLDFLRDATALTYDEVLDGGQALRSLRWEALTVLPSEIRLLRSLFEDLAEITGTPSPLGAGDRHPLTWPARTVDRRSLALRNL